MANRTEIARAQIELDGRKAEEVLRELTADAKMFAQQLRNARNIDEQKLFDNQLKDINKKLGVTILLITHQIEVIKAICDDVVIIDNGELIEQSTTLELFTQPKTIIAQELIRTVLKLELPEEIEERLHIEHGHGKIPVLRICFIGKTTTEPLLSSLVSKFDIHFNILQANIDLIQEQTIGIMVVEVFGAPEQISLGIEFLTKQGVKTEVIGYVTRND
jgi:D-methionine transport system ATP-binding protein